MSTHHHLHLNLRQRAHLEMVKRQFVPDFEPEVRAEVQALKSRHAGADAGGGLRDLRSFLWSSIDNNDSLDLDQIEYVERMDNGSMRVMVGVSDVDSLAPAGSAIDRHAGKNCTSVYTGVVTYPMLPEELSADMSSLAEGEDRRAVVVDMTLDAAGEVVASDVYPALVRNHAKLAYESVGNWLETGNQPPGKVEEVEGLQEQLMIQNEVRERLHALRQKHGSLHLQTIEARPVLCDGQVINLESVEENPAREIIENLMIAANITISEFLEAKAIPSIRRIVKTPERWDRIVQVAASFDRELPANPDVQALAAFLIERRKADPERFPDLSLTIVKLLGPGEYIVHKPGVRDEGHFALAVHDYTHATAPNRRYADLVTQRLVKSALSGVPSPYSVEALDDIARRCTEREDGSRKVERTMRKVAAAVMLKKHIGEKFDGIVTGVTSGGTYVRVFRPPVEGRIVQGEHGLDVGDKVRLRLLSTDPDEAYIDFARIR